MTYFSRQLVALAMTEMQRLRPFDARRRTYAHQHIPSLDAAVNALGWANGTTAGDAGNATSGG